MAAAKFYESEDCISMAVFHLVYCKDVEYLYSLLNTWMKLGYHSKINSQMHSKPMGSYTEILAKLIE